MTFKIRMIAAITASLGLTAVLGGAAHAQFVATADKPISYVADTMDADNSRHVVTFSGRVQFLQDDSRLNADGVRVNYAQNPATGKWDEVSTVEATGNVYYVVGDQVMTGGKAVYTKSTDTLVLSGDVVLKQGQNVMQGNRLVYNVGAGKSSMDGAPTGGSKGRVRGVFYPESQPAKKKP
ncbi:lipopolysaccharide transport periplasmic protein LptA [Asticcacaulis sp. BYS171W]|uniref:Lipopolysaccharide transport periplasmic protein LptA n=1 Tax=Asticcacaulis aquaticus TaxID=2984212 RepID=A0ABT5HSH9_9CAUL|nr:lipopolysaccharide transport periplasmic protein LptA [Asticcacaulis aquaticus]MDC7682897.1 lipopolysaccharide transport periplasmic protein LptA [Asticcacaulis aquaticus]